MFDALVPVSGGKDSIVQVHRALEAGLRVLAVNVDYGIKTAIGIQNLQVIPNMGATLITLRPEQKWHNRMIRFGLEDFGDPDLMSHALLYSLPLWTAVQWHIPLVVEGENTAFEYGGDAVSRAAIQINRKWFYRYIVTGGITPQYMSRRYKIPLNRLKLYDFPEKEIRKQKIKAIFLSQFFHWDSERHLKIAKRFGFQTLRGPREGTYRNYVGIDENINRVHQFIKVLKFGYGRATDHACEDIRAGRLTRQRAISLVRKYDTLPLSQDIRQAFCRHLGYTSAQLDAILRKYTNFQIVSYKSDTPLKILGHKHFTRVV